MKSNRTLYTTEKISAIIKNLRSKLMDNYMSNQGKVSWGISSSQGMELKFILKKKKIWGEKREEKHRNKKIK